MDGGSTDDNAGIVAECSDNRVGMISEYEVEVVLRQVIFRIESLS